MKTQLQNILYWVRVFWPRWEISDLSLNHQERRQSQRALRDAAPRVIIAYLIFGILACQCFTFFTYSLSNQRLYINEIVQSSLILFVLGLGVQVFLSFWRIYFAATGRAARMIAQRHERGDWELIYISPVDKGRWLRAQLQALTWQVWPLLRATMILQAALLPFWIYTVLDERQSAYRSYISFCLSSGGCQDSYLSLPLYTVLYSLLSFPIMGLLFLNIPLSMNALYTASATLIGSYSKSPMIVMVGNFIAVFLLRMLCGIIWLLLLLFLRILFNNPPYQDNSYATDSIYVMLLVAALLALFWEWLPLLLPYLLSSYVNHSGVILTLYASYLAAYILLPLLMAYLLSRATARRLERPP